MTYLVPFFQVEPDLAEKETRTATLFEPREGIPAGTYGLVESYCPDPDCDCRRVMINVVEKQHPTRYLAAIGYGFDRDAEDAGPYLDTLNAQSPYADALLRLVQEIGLSDPSYVARRSGTMSGSSAQPSIQGTRPTKRCARPQRARTAGSL